MNSRAHSQNENLSSHPKRIFLRVIPHARFCLMNRVRGGRGENGEHADSPPSLDLSLMECAKRSEDALSQEMIPPASRLSRATIIGSTTKKRMGTVYGVPNAVRIDGHREPLCTTTPRMHDLLQQPPP